VEFVHFLTSLLLDPSAGGKRLYREAVEQAVHAEACGYGGVAIPEHHLVNILLVPSPLQLAVKIAAHTSRIRLVTSVCQLPLRDMRIFAGEVVQAQALCDGRLVLGVGKGAFGVETALMGVPFEQTKERFAESLAVLEALLRGEDVGWDGERYRFDPLTIMPRPEDPIPIMLAIMAPPGIEAAAARGYDIQTTPISAEHGVLEAQVGAFRRGRARLGEARNRLALMRGVFLVRDEAHRRRMVETAFRYYQSFDNVFGGPGIVDRGVIRPLPREQTPEELGANLLICERDELVERLAAYAELGIDELILSSNFGQPVEETVEMMERFAAEVMPHLR
jgi:alkanesulfonate monooxygenase SsuD/methylene tetrahydromethanopterin reductase-like flavin-dependent oxidoreductase (luciferase family)